MSAHEAYGLAASLLSRLRKQAVLRNEDMETLLLRYATERLLYRLSISRHAGDFILKGARLFELWTGQAHRPTRDLDLMGYGSPDVPHLLSIFREVCQLPVEGDGLVFVLDEMAGEVAREHREYSGASLRIPTRLGKSKILLHIDFGFGDAVVPADDEAVLPTLLGQAAPRLRTYRRETVVAEKLQAMVSLGLFNSRLKDFYDVWYLSRHFDFEGEALLQALAATFARRQTSIPDQRPLALTADFYENETKRAQWVAFVKKSRLSGQGTDLSEVCAALREFLTPPLDAARRRSPLDARWSCEAAAWNSSEA